MLKANKNKIITDVSKLKEGKNLLVKVFRILSNGHSSKI